MGIFSEELRILDQNTVRYMMAELKRKIVQLDIEIVEKDIVIVQKDLEIIQRDIEIANKGKRIIDLENRNIDYFEEKKRFNACLEELYKKRKEYKKVIDQLSILEDTYLVHG